MKSNETDIQNLPPLVLPPLADPPPVIVASPPKVEPAPEKPKPKVEKPRATPPAPRRGANPFVVLITWIARFVIGVLMIANFFPLSFITAIAAFGWLQRRMQAIALRGWWKESPRRGEGSFQDFCDSLGLDAPVERPRWFWRERMGATFAKINKDSSFGGFLRFALTTVTLPIHSLWLNFKVGIAGLFTTYLLTGWGCSIMMFSWYFGWYNSFNKGYEDAFLGLTSGVLGSFLLILALIYVPMAQAHQAAAGEIAAFFQFRVVARLILTRLTAYLILIMGLAFVTLVFGIPRVFLLGDTFPANQEGVTPRQAYFILEGYWFGVSIFFFFSLLVLRTVAALVYRSAMLKAVRSGTIVASNLPPRLALWFEKLDIVPQLLAPQPMLLTLFRKVVGWNYRACLFAAIFLFWLLFVIWFYASYFLVFSEYRGILNHPVVQVPCIDWTPWHLVLGRDE
jgi:hypothetical protein